MSYGDKSVEYGRCSSTNIWILTNDRFAERVVQESVLL